MIEIDGYVIVGASLDRIYFSDPNSVTSWSASSYLTLSSNSGRIVTVAKYKGRLLGMGSDGIEFFYNAGNSSGAPFSRTGDSSGVGCGPLNSSQAVVSWADDIVVFSDPEGAIYIMDGASPRKISTLAVSRAIADYGTANLSVPNIFGKRYILASVEGGYSFLYDIDLGVWHESGFPDGTLLSNGIPAASTNAEDGRAINTSNTGGKVYKLNLSTPVYQDDGASYTMTIQTARLDFGTGNRKSIHYMELDSDIQASGTATLEISDDDAQNFTTIGTFDMTQDHPRIYRCGSYKGGINIRITHSANTAFRASTLKVVYTEGAI